MSEEARLSSKAWLLFSLSAEARLFRLVSPTYHQWISPLVISEMGFYKLSFFEK